VADLCALRYYFPVQIVEKQPTRTADPYLDTAVVDEWAPRTNQAAVALLGWLALATGTWWLAGLMGLQLAVGLVFGRRYCLPCVFYFEVIQPLTGEGPIEDARAPRFANILGAVFLLGASGAHLLGASALGWGLIALVAALATVAVVTGFCLGCTAYRFIARVRGVRPGHHDHLDLADFGLEGRQGAVIQFTHPLCSDCRELEGRLRAEGRDPVLIDVSRQGDLARKYHVAVVPTAFDVAANGTVVARLA
jgi:hypothetical protein